MRPSRHILAVVGACALLLLPGSVIVSAQSADQGPMMEQPAGEAQMAAPTMDAMPTMDSMPPADNGSSMDPDQAMMTDHGTMPSGTMPEAESAP